jgi:uncharacterized paraquat-inducible protein A
MTGPTEQNHILPPNVYAILWFMITIGMVAHITTGNGAVYFATLTGLLFLSALNTVDYFCYD